MAEEKQEPPRHGGAHAVAAARRRGVSTMFTLSGGHVFPLYDGAVKAGPPMRLVDVRHEQTAVFAAEATARLTRRPGLAVLTAGPGVTNGISAITTAHFNGSAVVVLAGRAPDYRWGAGSLQEIDHPLLLAPVTKRAWTEHRADQVGAAADEAFGIAATAHQGPVFVDFSLEALFGEAAEAGPAGSMAPPAPAPDLADVDVIAGLLAGADRPVLVLGPDVWLGAAETAPRAAGAPGAGRPGPAGRQSWLPRLQAARAAAVAADGALLASDADPVHPLRIYGELAWLLDEDAVVIGDGGDFVSYAGKYLEPKHPGGWLDPGPYGCLGTGLGYAIAARIARPSAQVVLLLGDGAAGFSLMDADTLVRHRLPVVMICGNNGAWGLEKHPMQALYGYDVAADLQPRCRYDEVVAALGGAGELVTRPDGIAPALRRAFDSGVPYLVNIATDPGVAYPRSTTGV